MMKRLVIALGIFSAVACSRSNSAPRPQPAPRPQAARVEPNLPAGENEEEEQRAIMNAVREMSQYPATADGARAFVTEMTRASIARDHERFERFEHELKADDDRFEMAFTFEASRQLRDRVVPGLEARIREVRSRLATLREPLTVNVVSALGSDFSDGQAHGFAPDMTRLRGMLMPAVRFYRVEVTGAEASGRVVIEPMAWLGGRWTWVGEAWTALPATPVTPPVVTPPVTGPSRGASAR